MSLDSHSISEGFRGQWNRLKATRISKSDIADKIKVTKISKEDFAEMMKKVSTSDVADKVRNGASQVASYARTVAEKIPKDRRSTKGVVELDSRGYQIYNIEDTGEIYIAQIPDKAAFDDEDGRDVIITRAEPGMFVGASIDDKIIDESVSAQKEEVDVASLFHNAVRGGSVEVPVTIGMNNGGIIEECSLEQDDVNAERVYQDFDMDPIIIMPVDQEELEIEAPVMDAPMMEEPVMEETPAEETVMVTPGLSSIEAEPLEKKESAEMIPSADSYIDAMYEPEQECQFATTSGAADPLRCNPMDGSFSQDPLTQITEKKNGSASPRFVFKDGKLQMVAPEQSASAFTVNRSKTAEDEVKMVLEQVQDIESDDIIPADTLDNIPDDGMEAMPFTVKKVVEKKECKQTESDCGKVTFDFDNRSSDDGFVGFSF